MALSATSFLNPQFQDYKFYWIKFYQPGTTSAKSMATDSSGETLIAKAEVRNSGFLETAGGAVFIPFIDGLYDAYLFPTEAAADANDTSSAIRIADNISGSSNSILPNPIANEILQGDPTGTFFESKTVKEATGVAFNSKYYPTVSAMKAAIIEVGEALHTGGYRDADDGGGAPYTVYASAAYPTPNEINEIALDNGLVAVLRNIGDILLEQWGCTADRTIDSRPYAQAAIEKAQQFKALGGKRTITSLGGTYMLASFYPNALPTHATGKKVGLWVEDAEWCLFDLKDGRFLVDTTVDAMKNLDEILCVCQETGDQAFMYIVNSRFDGGAWADIADEPDYNIRADYNVVKYSYFSRLHCRRAAESNIKIVGFVYQLDSCDARFASGRANFELTVAAVDGDGSTRTGYRLTNCVADYAGLHGYQISGGNGTTYASLDTCAADHIGRDRSNVTIAANLATSCAYRLSAVFGFNMSACGAETSTRFARITGARSFTLENSYCTNMGPTDGTTAIANIEMDGFNENCSIEAFEEGTTTDLTYTLQVTTPTGFNNTQVKVDNSILRSRINVITTDNDSSAPFVIGGLEDFYERGVRSSGGDAKLYGKPTAGRASSQWFEQNNFFSENNFYMRTLGADAVQPILTITNPGNDGFLGIELEVRIGGSLGSVIATPTRYLITAAKDGVNFAVTSADKINTSGGNYNLSAAWSGEVLQLTIQRLNPDTSTNYEMTAAVQCTAWGRAASTYQTFNWEDQI